MIIRRDLNSLLGTKLTEKIGKEKTVKYIFNIYFKDVLPRQDKNTNY